MTATKALWAFAFIAVTAFAVFVVYEAAREIATEPGTLLSPVPEPCAPEIDDVVLGNVLKALNFERGKPQDRLRDIGCIRDWAKALADTCQRDAYAKWLDTCQRSAQRDLDQVNAGLSIRSDYEIEREERERKARRYEEQHQVPAPPSCSREKAGK